MWRFGWDRVGWASLHELRKGLGIDKAETYAAKAGAQSSAAKGTLYYLLGGQLEKLFALPVVRRDVRNQLGPFLRIAPRSRRR